MGVAARGGMADPAISILIPTQRRPGGLERAALSALRQTGVATCGLELLIVDNDQTPSARPLAARFAAQAMFPVVYVHEPRAGVAHVRNAAVNSSRGALLAFLDDDEEAPEGWLAALLDAQRTFAADAVFGPVRARAPIALSAHRAYLQRFFSREGPEAAGVIHRHYGCGNSLVRRAALPDPATPFRVVRNLIGGEDDLLFGEMGAAGACFAWAPEAWVWEDPVAERLTLGYTVRRAFAYGQGPTSACAIARPPDRIGVAKWMAIGVAQSLVFGAVAGAKWLLGAPDRAEALDRAARGLGKVLWWTPFKIQFYGRPA